MRENINEENIFSLTNSSAHTMKVDKDPIVRLKITPTKPTILVALFSIS